MITRFGIVLGKDGGMLGELVPLFKKFLGGLVESGEHWLSWIHQQDLVRAYLFLPDHPELSGPVNFTSPNPMRNRDFARALRMGVVFQESFLFNHSIRENLRLGRADATDAEIKTAARAAEIHEAIMEMPKRYDTMVGERGGTLSGGQCQRLAIARALLNDPEILILDEATSALDPDTEEAISATLEQVGRSRTVLMVSHRLGSVRHMDRIVVLDHGRIIEQGRHDELIKKDGFYARPWLKQGGSSRREDGSITQAGA